MPARRVNGDCVQLGNRVAMAALGEPQLCRYNVDDIDLQPRSNCCPQRLCPGQRSIALTEVADLLVTERAQGLGLRLPRLGFGLRKAFDGLAKPYQRFL